MPVDHRWVVAGKARTNGASQRHRYQTITIAVNLIGTSLNDERFLNI